METEVTPKSPCKSDKKKVRRHRERVESVSDYKPILTIKSCQGFVFNQELFIPPYIKDRYRTSTSSPSCNLGIPGISYSGMDYEVECVEIRVSEGEVLKDLVPL
jgi:hypothetical protein